MPPWGFQGPTTGLGTLRETQSFADKRRCTLSRGEPLPGCLRPYKEKRTLPRPGGSVPQIARVTALGGQFHLLDLGTALRNIHRIPFRAYRRACIRTGPTFGMAFAYDLGSADPCSTAVHMEPFSTSVFRGLVGIFATTTEICTRGGSSRARARTFDAHRGDPPTRRSVDERENSLPRRPGIGSSLQRHPFSGLVDSAGELLHTP